ncbi:hypothetical protein BZA05DRAFT_78658 [Tricharina praecox]|uniref:uncharacterized protein n=1 Tax=Tricharina praecox TaxID=43433 RepID=UPI00221F92DA|nr:uncharacterized protein BZA05DRAFT_78658 [Tricharina praecox]KAI5849848.1 hypothetical protein BZA05DRAFT_78658 [Tricharina praecox]
MSGPSKLRRSARSRLKVDYTKGLGDGDDDDYADSSQVGDSVALAAKTGSATRRTIAASAKMQNQDVKVEGDGDEDSDYARRPKKKPKLAVVKRQRVILSYAERVELRMKTTCFIFNIPYSTFDKWPFSLNPEQDGGPSLSTMPNEVLLLIFSFSRSDDLLSLRKTCKHFRALLRHESIWRESRLNYLPPLPSELPTPLPFGLTEIKLYLLSFSKSCSHCGQVAKPQARPRVFYNWGMRGCKDCVKQYTILHKDLMALLSKKCGFDFHEREALVSTLESHDHSMWR